MPQTLMDAILNAQDEFGQTPLMTAVLQGNLNVARFLLSRGADTSLVDKQGNTLLHYAIMSGRLGLVRELWDPAGLKEMTLRTNHDGLTAFQLGFTQEICRSFGFERNALCALRGRII